MTSPRLTGISTILCVSCCDGYHPRRARAVASHYFTPCGLPGRSGAFAARVPVTIPAGTPSSCLPGRVGTEIFDLPGHGRARPCDGGCVNSGCIIDDRGHRCVPASAFLSSSQHVSTIQTGPSHQSGRATSVTARHAAARGCGRGSGVDASLDDPPTQEACAHAARVARRQHVNHRYLYRPSTVGPEDGLGSGAHSGPR